MAGQTKKQPIDIESKAAIIGRKLKRLCKKCADHNKWKSISNEIAHIMSFMAEQLTTDHWHLFQDHFIGHLKLFAILLQSNEDQMGELISKFMLITEVLCEMILNKRLPAKYLCRLLSTWLQCVERVPSAQKYRIFRNTDRNLRQNFGRCLLGASCYSMQMHVLNIICSYVHGENLNDDNLAAKPFEFIRIFDGVIDGVTKDDLLQAATEMFAQKNPLTFNAKHRILNLLNGRTEEKNRAIYSMPIKSLKVFGKSTQQYDSGWMHLNIMSGTVEFSMPTNDASESKKLRIKTRKLQRIQINEFIKIPSLDVKFVLYSKSQRKLGWAETAETVKSTVVTMGTECVKSELISRLSQVFTAIDIEDIKIDPKSIAINRLADETFCSKLETTTRKCVATERPIQKDPPLQKQDSTFYGKEYADIDFGASNDSAIPTDVPNCRNIQNCFVSSTRKRTASKVQNTGKIVEPIDADKSCVYDFVGSDDERPVAKKPRQGRGRGRRVAQPKKRSKPAPFPRLDCGSSFERREKKYTVSVKTPVGKSAKTLSVSANAKMDVNLGESDQFAVTSSNNKMGAKAKQNKVLDIQNPVIVDYEDLDIENMDINANNKRCQCHNETLKRTLEKIEDSADHALNILQTTKCICC